MAFNRVKYSDAFEQRSFKEAMIAAAKYEPKRSMSNRRLIGSTLSWIFGLFLAYCAMFYVPAFIDLRGALDVAGIKQKTAALPQAGEKSGVLTPYKNLLNARRGFFRSGQILQVDYALSPGTELTLTIRKCTAPVIVEIFKCTSVQDQTVRINNPREGSQMFRVSDAGFYYYSEVTRNLDGSDGEKPFVVLWRRRQK